MGYHKTASRAEFEIGAFEALKMVRKTERKKYAAGGGVSDYLLCAALFLTHARFENYIGDAIKWYVQEINKRGLASSQLPGRVRECQLLSSFPHGSFKRYYISGDERELLDALNSAFIKSDWKWAQNTHSGPVDANAVVGSCGYPSPINFPRLFYKLGINIEAELGRRLRENPRDVLEDVGGVRTEMAHVGKPPHITAQDIAEKIEKLLKLVEGIDRVLSAHLSGL